MAKPKLALIPAAQGSKFYSVLPSSGIGDFSFTRNTSATRINKDGYIESVPALTSRLNYPLIDGVVKGCPSHLLEPSRTNLITYSEDFSNWNAADLTVTDNNAISPNGILNASKLTANSGTIVKRIQLTGLPTSSANRSYSIFVKTDDINAIQLLHSGDLQGFARFDLVNYTVGSVGTKTTATIENYGNGWYRCTAIFNSTNASGSSLYLYLNDSSVGGYGGSTSQVGDLFIFGAQYEEGSYPTSYIVSNSGSATTRGAESAVNAGDASTFNDSEGVLMADFSSFADSTFKYITISDGSIQNRITIILLSNNNIYGQVRAANSEVFFRETSGISIEQNNKIAVSYKTNQCKLFVNGFQIGSTDTFASMPLGLNTLAFDDGNGNSDFYGNTKQIQYFDSADIDLETLTSWTSFNEMAISQQYSLY